MSTTDSPDLLPAAWIPDGTHERLHDPTGDDSFPWKETWYISVRDDASDQTVCMHMTISANRTPPTRVGVTVAQGHVATSQVLRNEGENTDERLGNEMAHLELVNLSGDGDHELRWVGELDEASFDLTLKGKHFASYWDAMFAGYYPTGEKDGHQYSHFEQVITAEGWVQLKGGEKVPFDGIGWRDRGWGRRKTQTTFGMGWDLAAAVLPDDSVFSIIALKSTDYGEEDPTPIGGWRSTATSLVPATGGIFYKDNMAWPSRIELDFLDGYRLESQIVRRTSAIADPWHDAEPEGMGIGVNMRDYYSVFADSDGREFTMFFNHGYVHKVDVLRHTRFMHSDPPS